MLKKQKKVETRLEDGYKIIFVTSFFHKKLNRRIFAKDCGKKAFTLKVPIDN